MEQVAKNQTKKFLQLLKQAQNTAFVGLVTDNLNVQLTQKPWKLLKVLNFVAHDLPRSNGDFTRLKVSEGLIPMISDFFQKQSENFLDSILDKINNENEKIRDKALDHLAQSIIAIDLQDPDMLEDSIQNKLCYVTLQQMMKQNRNFFQDLIQNYHPLLAENNVIDNEPVLQNKESIKKLFMESAIGIKTDKLKLSDFIDENFFEDIDADMNGADQQDAGKDKQSLFELISQFTKESDQHLIEIPSQTKRTKTSTKNGSLANRFLVMSPLLALVIHFTGLMTSPDWKQRQGAASTLKIIFQQENIRKQLEYYILQVDSQTKKVSLKQSFQVAIEKLLLNIVPRLVIFILKDQFSDFEELKMLTPAREEAVQLVFQISQFKEVEQDLINLVQTMPIILKAVETETWVGRYNFFLLMKSLISKHEQLIFTMFNKVLVESLIIVEDEVRIIVTEIIEQLLPIYLQQPDYLQQISVLLQNLQENLKQSDEIESSAISVFNLVLKILDTVPNLDQLKFKADLDTFCPFNFHKVINVRYSYNQMMNKCLQNLNFELDELAVLTKLTLQSLTMERPKSLVRLLLSNLRLLVQKFPKYSEDQPEYRQFIESLFTMDQFFNWIYSYQIHSFESFLFFESKNFENVGNDYYKIVNKPLSFEEIQASYFSKMKNLCHAYATMMENSGEMAQFLLGLLEQTTFPPNLDLSIMQPPIHEGHLMFILTLNYYLSNTEEIGIDIDQLNSLVTAYNQVCEEQISIYHFKELESLQKHIQLLQQITIKHQLVQYEHHIVELDQVLNQCYQDMRLSNISMLQQSIQQLIGLLGQCQIPEVFECFSGVTQLFASLFSYATTMGMRVKSVAAAIHTKIVQLQKCQLSSQLNDIIKPLLTATKTEKVKFLQKICAKSCVDLMSVLHEKMKKKPCGLIIAQIISSIEDEQQDDVALEGCTYFINQIIKRKESIFQCFENKLLEYIKKPITDQNAKQWVKVCLFLLVKVKDKQQQICSKLYEQESGIIQNQLGVVLNLQQDIKEMPDLIEITFKLFPQQQVRIVSTLVKMMQIKSKNAFDCLIKLLNSENPDLMKFIPVFILPVITNIQYSRTIFNNDKQITLILAQLLQLLPLNLAAISDLASGKQSDLLDDLREQAQEGYNFLQVFVNNEMITEYKLQIPVQASLREYQKQGITWMASLGKYNLNCALCDDMGLGKTLQSLCVILNESHLKFQKTKEKPINLIVCPTTIAHNWHMEISKFFKGAKCVVYEGSSSDKTQIINNASNYDIIIASYEKVRGEFKAFQNLKFFYLVLDEAHIIKNAKAKTTQAVKQIQCEKKIILTGTPLQNRVSELWSIFDFLMPGFLEEESIFNKKYNQYLTTNIKKLSEKLEETQSFIDALKSLKKRIQPFILRRTKAEVLKELPPKIIQDYVCQMTGFQKYVHDLIKHNYPIDQSLQQSEDGKPKQGGNKILRNLILHRQVCNHPMFVTSNFETDKKIQKHFKTKNQKELMQYDASGKLQGLVNLLTECEIIEILKLEGKEELKTSEAENQTGSMLMDMAIQSTEQIKKEQEHHRVLIFCQMSKFVKMITEEILDRFQIKYLQLLSSHQGKQRVEIVEQFNNDPTIRVLILTTQIGGLGLNLTGADTVIFAEHDWNPMKDLQAIDRAHRIGQTKTVNVYRLIVSDTIEEDIMSLQKFKQNLAKSLIQSKGIGSEDASSLEMSDLLKSFEEHTAYTDMSNKKPATVQDKIISNLEEIWQGTNFEDL